MEIRRLRDGETRSTDVLTYQSVFGRGLDLEFGPSTAAGKNVTAEVALKVSAVYGCVRILSDNVATLPLDAFIRRDGVKRPFRPRPSWLDFNVGPHNKIDVLGQMMVSLLLYGNAYVATYRDRLGEIVYVEVLDPRMVEPEMVNGNIVFRVGDNILTDNDILHVRGMTLPGQLKGCSPITYARETIGLSLAATEFGATFFGNGAHPGMVLELPKEAPVSEVGLERMKASWNAAHRGSYNANKLAVLTEGAVIKQMTISPDDAQFLQTRSFQVPDIARVFGVPVHLLAHADSPQLGSSIAEQNVGFVQHSLRPWVERIEQGLSDAQRRSGTNPRVFIALNVSGLMRGDYASRVAANAALVREGILTINEARAQEDLPPVPWGDEPISVQVQEQDDDPEPDPEPQDAPPTDAPAPEEEPDS